MECSFNTLWIYTALKHFTQMSTSGFSFNTLWIYTALKHVVNTNKNKNVSIPSEFTLLSNSTTPVLTWLLVSIPSEFTLLSNSITLAPTWLLVSIPSEFTLLSNNVSIIAIICVVSIPSEFTLLSNSLDDYVKARGFQYPLNLHCSQT